MSKEEFVNKLKGPPIREAKAIDAFRKRLYQCDDINVVDEDDGQHIYRATVELPLRPKKVLPTKQWAELECTLDDIVAPLEVQVAEEIILYLPMYVEILGSTQSYVEAMAKLLDFVDNKDKHVKRVMGLPEMDELIKKFNLEKLEP